MKKISLLVLTIISFLFVGMLMPNTYADEGYVDITLNVVSKGEGEVLITPENFSVPFGNTVSLDLAGLILNENQETILVHEHAIVPNNTLFMMSGSTNVSVIIKETIEEVTDFVAVFVDTNGALLDVVYNPDVAPTTLSAPTKPGYTTGIFNTSIITEDTVFVAEYELDGETPITVTVNDGTKDLETPKFNDVVTVSTDLENFTHWEDEFGFVVSYEPIFKFTALNNITLTAKTGGTEGLNLYLRDVTGIRTNGESFLAKLHLPSNYELVEWGFVGSITNADGQYQPKLGDADVVSNPSKAFNAVTGEFLTTITGDGFAYTRAYATVYNNTTELFETVYSMVRNNIQINFEINYEWLHDFDFNSGLGAYVRGDFNNWSLSDKMIHSNIESKSRYNLTIPIKFIGDEISQSFKYFIFVENDWNPKDGWQFHSEVHPTFRFKWYHPGDNINMTIIASEGVSQMAAQSPFNHYN